MAALPKVRFTYSNCRSCGISCFDLSVNPPMLLESGFLERVPKPCAAYLSSEMELYIFNDCERIQVLNEGSFVVTFQPRQPPQISKTNHQCRSLNLDSPARAEDQLSKLARALREERIRNGATISIADSVISVGQISGPALESNSVTAEFQEEVVRPLDEASVVDGSVQRNEQYLGRFIFNRGRSQFIYKGPENSIIRNEGSPSGDSLDVELDGKTINFITNERGLFIDAIHCVEASGVYDVYLPIEDSDFKS